MFLREFLFVEKKYWTGNKSGFGKEEHKYNFPLVSKKGVFLAGFLPRILPACQTRSIPVEVIGEFEKIEKGKAKEAVKRDNQLDRATDLMKALKVYRKF